MADFDPEAIRQHNVTARDIENARRYVAILQGTGSRLFNSELDVPIFFPTDADIERARMLLDRLKRFDRSKEHGTQ